MNPKTYVPAPYSYFPIILISSRLPASPYPPLLFNFIPEFFVFHHPHPFSFLLLLLLHWTFGGMSDRRGRNPSARDDRSTKQTPSRAPSRNRSRSRREPSRDRSETAPRGTGSSNPGIGPGDSRNPRHYPPSAGGRSGSGGPLQQAPSLRQTPASVSAYSSAPSVDLPVYVGRSYTTSKHTILDEWSPSSSYLSGSVPLPHRERTTSMVDTGVGPQSRHLHDPRPSRPSSSNPMRPLSGSTGGGKYSDPTAPVVSYPGPPSWARQSTHRPPSTVSNYPDHGQAPASKSTSPPPPGLEVYEDPRARPFYSTYTKNYCTEPEAMDAPSSAHSSSLGPPYTMDIGRAGYSRLSSEPHHPGEIFVPPNSSGLSQAQSRPSNYSARHRAASPYTKAAQVEARQTERRAREGDWPVKGGSNPAIGKSYTQDSHARLADVAGRSALEWEGTDLDKSNRNNSRRESHDNYVTEMEKERERKLDEERQRGKFR